MAAEHVPDLVARLPGRGSSPLFVLDEASGESGWLKASDWRNTLQEALFSFQKVLG